jgi:ornithine cyclodeaminase
VKVATSPAALARECRLVVTVTHGRGPLLVAGDLLAGTHVSAVGADAPGKQELDPQILRHASLVLVDSLAQCLACGEAQHGGTEGAHVRELGSFVLEPEPFDKAGITVADFSGLPLLDLFVAEHAFRKWSERAGTTPDPPAEPAQEASG